MNSILYQLNGLAYPQIAELCLRGTAVIAIAAVVAIALRKRSAGARHLVWLTGLAGLAAVPVLALAFPSWNIIPVRAEQVPAASEPVAGESSANLDIVAQPTVPLIAIAAEGVEESVPVANYEPALVAEELETQVAWFPNWGIVAAVAWGLVAGFLLLRMLAGNLFIVLAKRRAHRVEDSETLGTVADLKQSLGLRREVLIFREAGRSMPMSCGLFRAAIILPAESEDWDAEQLRSVLLHELAHVKRWDPVLHAGAQVVRALHWFNPVVWLAWGRLKMERERACDDLALESGLVGPVDYARHLLNVVSGGRSVGFHRGSGLAMGEHAQIKERLGAILDDGKQRAAVSRRGAVLGLAAALALTAPVALLQAAPQGAAPAEREEVATDTPAIPGVKARAPRAEKAARAQTDAVDALFAAAGVADPDLGAGAGTGGGGGGGGGAPFGGSSRDVDGDGDFDTIIRTTLPGRGAVSSSDTEDHPGVRVWTLPAPDGTSIYECREDGLITKMDIKTKQPLWTRSLKAPVRDPVILGRHSLFVASGERAMLICIDKQDGSTLFRLRQGEDDKPLSTDDHPGASFTGRKVTISKEVRKTVAALPVDKSLDAVAVAEFLNKVLGEGASATADAKNRKVFVQGDARMIVRARGMIATLGRDAAPQVPARFGATPPAAVPAAVESGLRVFPRIPAFSGSIPTLPETPTETPHPEVPAPAETPHPEVPAPAETPHPDVPAPAETPHPNVPAPAEPLGPPGSSGARAIPVPVEPREVPAPADDPAPNTP